MLTRSIHKHRLNLCEIVSTKIKGNDTSNTVNRLSVNDTEVTSHRVIVTALAGNISHNSSSVFSTNVLASVPKKIETQTIKLSSDNAEV